MASRLLEALHPGVREKAKRFLELLASQGVSMLVYCGYRDLPSQARLWRSTRTAFEIADKIKKLGARGLGFLADVLEQVGPQAGPLGKHKTMAAPGESWHNFGRAFDAVPILDGKPDWDMHDTQAWGFVQTSAKIVGLEWAGTWPIFQESVHFQDVPAGNPLKMFPPEQVKRMTLEALALSVELNAVDRAAKV